MMRMTKLGNFWLTHRVLICVRHRAYGTMIWQYTGLFEANASFAGMSVEPFDSLNLAVGNGRSRNCYKYSIGVRLCVFNDI